MASSYDPQPTVVTPTPAPTPTPFLCPEEAGKESVTPTKSTEKKCLDVEAKPLADPSMATFLDVAVLRCLFTSQWLEDGIDWALSFLLNR